MSDAQIDKIYLDHELAHSLANTPQALIARTLESIGIAYGFMIVKPIHQGLGACIVGETDNDLISVNQEKSQRVKNYFNLKETEIITGAIILGYPVKESIISPRKPENEIIFFHSNT